MYKQLKKMRQEEGFTLIELLIVIVILGILAAIVVFSVQGITDNGTKSACKADVAEVNTAIEAYYAQAHAYPTANDDITKQTPLGTPPQYRLLQSFPGDVTVAWADTPPTVTGSTC